ncbi:MAG: hypothetical protein ABW318_05515, partial [Vicinamibacterales bacterium]
ASTAKASMRIAAGNRERRASESMVRPPLAWATPGEACAVLASGALSLTDRLATAAGPTCGARFCPISRTARTTKGSPKNTNHTVTTPMNEHSGNLPDQPDRAVADR